MAIDPICKMKVSEHTAIKANKDGQVYYFCSQHCQDKFLAQKQPDISSQEKSNSVYICPMHPEVVREKPGDCPKCGMALEPQIGQEEQAQPELKDMTRRFIISCILTLPTLLIAMAEMLPENPLLRLASPKFFNWLQFILATPVVWWCGWPFFKRCRDSIVNRSLNMFTLIALGTGMAYAYSLVAILFADIFPMSFRQHHGLVAVYFESASVITVLVLLGQVLELRASSQTTGAIRELLKLTPKIAHRINPEGQEEDIPLEGVQVKDRLKVLPGEKIPVDGTILAGASFVDESMISGEATPVLKDKASLLTAGTINGTGSFIMQAERVGDETLLAQIVRMVSQAQRSRAPIQRLADLVSGYFVPAIILIAGLTAVVWTIAGPEPKMFYALVNAVSVLIIACPCALGLATPMSIMVGTGRGARVGVLIKNAETLETMEKVNTLVVDKTGTLTEGKPRLVTVVPTTGISATDLLKFSSSVERHSEHPLAAAIVQEAQRKNIELSDVEDFQSLTGKGVLGKVGSKNIAVGNLKLLEQLNIDAANLIEQAEALRQDGQTVIFVVIDGRIAGLFGVTDPIKETTPEAIKMLHQEGIRIVMLSGDNRTTAEAVGEKLNLDRIEAEVLPNQKAEAVKQMQERGMFVAMAGDGINDAPALAQAQVGIAMGTGTDVAMEAAGITLIKGDLRGIVRARRLSRLTMRNIRQNLFLAFAYNLICVPIAAGVLYPRFGLWLNPMIASAAMSFSSVSVIGNALRLRKVNL